MKIFIRTYSDGRKAYGTGLIANSINNQLPISVKEFEADDEMGQRFLDNPTAYNITEENGKLIIEEK